MVQFITHCTGRYSYVESARLALEGGCRWIQLRMKNSTPDEIYAAAKEVKKMCEQHHATFIIDDYVEIAKDIHPDGVHLGKLDMPIGKAREILGEKAIIGGTANTFEDVENLYQAGANYIGCGPFRYTTTKANLSPILGIEGYRQIISRMKENNIAIPVVAIGGITEADIPDLMKLGIDGIALSSSILNAANPVEEMKRIIKIVQSWKNL
jgi:thiamine-phosphate pyrophosphorylase